MYNLIVNKSERKREIKNKFQGQPNAMTGVCDGDVMVINNGRSSFELCGWNSGQHGENLGLFILLVIYNYFFATKFIERFKYRMRLF